MGISPSFLDKGWITNEAFFRRERRLRSFPIKRPFHLSESGILQELAPCKQGCLPVAGLHRACPSAALDEIVEILQIVLIWYYRGTAGFGQYKFPSKSGGIVMIAVFLRPHDLAYAERMFALVSDPAVSGALSLQDQSVEDTKRFIRHITEEERAGRAVSRVVFNEKEELIGVTTLMFIDRERRRCHIGSWLGRVYWGKGYNQLAKEAILSIAFGELDLDIVFAGARTTNIRSQKAQEKLPYVTLHVESEYPEEHAALEQRQQHPCVLHAFKRDDFLRYLAEKERAARGEAVRD
jgi:[ribosomal protein S5]-alanine N-acetyltransferase